MAKFGLELSFDIKSLDGDYFYDFVSHFLRFEPLEFMKNHNYKPWNREKHLKIIKKCGSEDSLMISNSSLDLFITTITNGIKVRFRVVKLRQDSTFTYDNKDIESIINREGFTSCFYYNDDYDCQQSAKSESAYKTRGIPMDKAKELSYKLDDFGEKVFDISINPGRSHLLSYSWIMPAYKMWFGKGFYNLVSKERLLAFNDAIEVKELDNDVVFIHLFEKIEESGSEKAKEVQWAFRRWCDFDGLIKKYG